MTYPPARAARPGTVTAAVALQYAIVALNLIGLVIALIFGDDMNAAMAKSLENDAGMAPAQAESAANVGDNGIMSVSTIVVAMVVEVVLAILLARGNQVGRILVWVLVGLGMVCWMLSTAGTAFLGAAESSEQINDALQDGYAAAGAWYQPFTIFTTVLKAVAQVGVIVLLALPASHPFFRKTQPYPVLPPETYR